MPYVSEAGGRSRQISEFKASVVSTRFHRETLSQKKKKSRERWVRGGEVKR